jgi:hypothetical protein
MTTLPKLEGRITISSTQTMVVTDSGGVSQNRTVAAGDYYLTTTATGGSNSLLTTVKNALDASGQTYTVTVDDTEDTSTGKVSILVNAGTTTIDFTSATTLRDILGFAGNPSTASGVTGEYQARYLWLPNCGRSGSLGPDPTSTSYDMGGEEVDGTFTFSPSGASKRLAYTRRFVETMNFEMMKGSKTWIALETTTNESMQKFWRDVISQGLPFRYHYNRANDSVYFTWVATNFNNFKPSQVQPGWVGANSLWSIGYDARKLV